MSPRRFTQSELDQLEMVIFHLSMLEYGMNLSFNRALEQFSRLGNVPQVYNTFALLHLITTLFLVDNRNKPMGGYVYPVLARFRLAGLLEPIRKTMERKLGQTKFGDYLRRTRNKLATHDGLEFSSLPTAEQDVTFNDQSLQLYERLMDQFDRQLRRLKGELERRHLEATRRFKKSKKRKEA